MLALVMFLALDTSRKSIQKIKHCDGIHNPTCIKFMLSSNGKMIMMLDIFLEELNL